MGWRSETFLEMQTKIQDAMPEIKQIDLFNNQLEDYRGETNLSEYLTMPLVLIEFVGGDWEHDGDRRIAKEYFFRFHLVIQDYTSTHTANPNQADALAHLDMMDALANALDLHTLTYAHSLSFVREEIDTSRTSIISHILDFVANVVDGSLEEQNAPDTVIILETEEIVSTQENIQAIADNNVVNHPSHGFRIP